MPQLKNKKIYLNYICLCLDTGDGDAAVFAFDLYKNELKNQNLGFLEKKVNSAIKNGILSEIDRNKFNLKNQQQFCPICLSLIKSNPRYPEYVCSKCVKKATDKIGRSVRFSQQPSSKNLLGITTLNSYFLDSKENYGSNLCWIDGIPCRAEEARFGGIVIQKLTDKELEQDQNRNELIMEMNSTESVSQDSGSEIEYVDSDGNAISIEDIDPTAVDFEDEFGRKVDFKGNLIELHDSDIKWVEIAEKMLVSNAHCEMIRHCRTGLENEKNKGNSKLWNLLGLGYAATGNILKAKESFLQSINCSTNDEIDSITFANFVTASFDHGDSKSGLLAIENFFDLLNYDGKQIILDSLLEAVRTRLISKEDLSERLQTILMMK